MKSLAKILLIQLLCLPILVTGAMAQKTKKKADANRNKSSAVSRTPAKRPNVRPAQSASRNPFTQSKAKPSKPNSRPLAKPTARPASKPKVPARKPATKPKPALKPTTKPATKPAARPNPPGTRPTAKPGKRPDAKPAARPGDKPANRPAAKPAAKPKPPARPGQPPAAKPGSSGKPTGKPATKPKYPARPITRPDTRPGAVKYPKPATRPANVKRPANRKPDVRPGKNTRPVRKPDFNNTANKRPGKNGQTTNKNNWWNSSSRVNNTRVNNTNIVNVNRTTNINNTRINNNFQNNVNWSTNRRNWGYNPWWNRPATRPWYGGSWNNGWNNNYYRRHSYYRPPVYPSWPGYVVYEDNRNDVARAIGWGLVGWSLGKLVYDTGYQTYSNPYPAQPVPSAKGGQVTYNQPITVVAAETAPADGDSSGITEQSESFIAESQAAFLQNDYLTALDYSNKAIAEAPGDGALHEYRALVLFALGKYSEAAGVLNPVLAGGPGWDWTTMISLYPSSETYMSQLEALEKYSAASPDAADAHFLLGYHYMICGHLAEANTQFARAAELQPADSVSAQLRELTAATSDGSDGEVPAEEDGESPVEETPAPEPVPLEQLTGTWVSDKGDQGTVSLAFKDDGKFIWTYQKGDTSNEFGGDFSMNDDGLLVLDAEDSQMVAAVELPQDDQLKFILAGGPPGDPGLLFAKK